MNQVNKVNQEERGEEEEKEEKEEEEKKKLLRMDRWQNENTMSRMVKLSLKEYTFLHKNRQDGALLEQLSQVTFDLRIKCFC